MISWFEKHNKFSWLVTFLIAIFIFYTSSLSFKKGTPGGIAILPTAYHISAFFFLAFFLSISLLKGKNKILILPAILLSVIYGITDELHQLFVQGRNSSLFDASLDTAGILFASVFYLIILEFRNKPKLSSPVKTLK